MPFAMTALNRSKSGAYTARKGIPKDVQEEYGRLYVQRHEAKLTLPAKLTLSEAKARHSEWLSEIETRIATIRAQKRGDRQPLTQRQTQALAGEWYREFTARHEEDPGTPEHWDALWRVLISELEEFVPEDHWEKPSWKNLEWTRNPEVRDGIRPLLAREAKADQFLADKGLSLTDEAYRLFLDCLLDEFIAAVLLLEGRARGDYSPDERLEQFPKFERTPKVRKQADGLTPRQLFELWVSKRRPSDASVDRWRGVFLDLEKHFPGRTADSITPEEAQQWAEACVTKKRSPRTVMEVWVNAAHTVFQLAVDTKKLKENPFKGVKVIVPKKKRMREREFRADEAALILRSSLSFSDDKAFDAARRWVPWLCAYTGARAGEITQLRGQDVFQREGHWVIQITPEAGTVKTNEARVVPLHEHLIEQGFIEFVRRKGKGPLFYNPDSPSKAKSVDPTNPPKARAVKQRERIGEWVRHIGVTDRQVQPNHAWRHTFIRRAYRVGIEKNIRTAMCGHGFDETSEHYETPSISDMAEALKKFHRYEIVAPDDANTAMAGNKSHISISG